MASEPARAPACEHAVDRPEQVVSRKEQQGGQGQAVGRAASDRLHDLRREADHAERAGHSADGLDIRVKAHLAARALAVGTSRTVAVARARTTPSGSSSLAFTKPMVLPSWIT